MESVKVSGMTLTEAREAVAEHLKNQLTAPEVSVSLAESSGKQQIAGEHLVGPDGHVNLGTYGSVYVAGHDAGRNPRGDREAPRRDLLEDPKVSVDVYAYNSLVYYIVTEGPGVRRLLSPACHGPDRRSVLDAVAQSHVANPEALTGRCWVWVSRPATANAEAQILPVDWQASSKKLTRRPTGKILPGIGSSSAPAASRPSCRAAIRPGLQAADPPPRVSEKVEFFIGNRY